MCQRVRSMCRDLLLALALTAPLAACDDSSSADAGVGRDGAVASSGGATGAATGGRSGAGGGSAGQPGTGGAGVGSGGRSGAGGVGVGSGGRSGSGGIVAGGSSGTGGRVGSGGQGALDAAVDRVGDTALDAAIDSTIDGGSADGGGTAPSSSDYTLGMNLDGISYWSDYAPYVDMARAICANDESTCWDRPDGNPGVAIDGHGYPTVTAGAGMWAPYPSGTYQVTWEGTGTLDLDLDRGSFTKTGANAGTLEFVKGAHLQVNVTKPPVTSIRILSPQSEYDPGHKFRRAFLDKLRPFSTLRTMDMMKTNSNTAIKWSERSWPEDFSSGKAHGVPFEDLISLANESGKNLWINIPTLANDDFVCRTARLFRYGEHGDKSDAPCDPTAPGNPPADAVPLASNLTLYVEYGNELWNWGFDAPHAIFCMVWGKGDGAFKNPPEDASCPWNTTAPTSAIGVAALKDSTLPWSTDNVWAKSSQLAAVLTKRVSTLFKTVFKDAPAQVKIVQGAQSAWPTGDGEIQLSFLSQAYGDVTRIVDVLAVAPYLDILDVDGNPVAIPSGTQAAQLNSIFAALESSLTNTVASWLAQDKRLADQYHLPLVAYEGGQGLAGSSNQEAKIAAQNDPRMFDLTRKYFKLWRDTVGARALFNYYSFATMPAEYGSWGALTEGDQPGSQKWDALLSLLCLAGDANLDGHVNSADLAIIQSNLNKTGMWWQQGDFNHDGTVNQADLDLYSQNVGKDRIN